MPADVIILDMDTFERFHDTFGQGGGSIFCEANHAGRSYVAVVQAI